MVRPAPLALLLCVGLAASGCGGDRSAPVRSAPSSGGSSGCPETYKPALCVAGQQRCVTDANGCESCTCDDPPMPAPTQ